MNSTKPVEGGIARHFTVMRGFPLYNRDGREIYDPVEPLSMGTLLRLAPNENAPLYLELDTHGVEAGTYHSLMMLKSATPGCPSVSIAVKVEVTELDLAGVQMDKAGYDYVGGSFINGRNGCPRLVRQLVERDYNILFVGYPNQLLPRMRNEGGWEIPDLGALDRHIDAAFAGGLAKERAKLWIYLGMESQHPWNVPRTEKGGRVPFASEEWNAGIRYMVEEIVRHVGERRAKWRGAFYGIIQRQKQNEEGYSMSGTKKTKIRITDTTLRDAHQSLWATRMRTDDILAIASKIDDAGYYSLECWGGATFDVCMRFLRENPWERLRLIKKACPKTPLQMLLRGQNILGYKHYPDDIVDRFVALACENGMDIFRVFDALNDPRNLEQAIASVKKYGGHAQGTISYTTSPVHTVANYVKLAKAQAEMGIDSLCIKDMAGILTPGAARELVSALVKALPEIPVQVHSHMTSGMATAMYMAAAEAGAGCVDCAISTMSSFSSQPPTESVMTILESEGFDTGLDRTKLTEINDYFKKLKAKRQPASCAKVEPVDAGVLVHAIPGGMISNLRSQLAQQSALDRLPEVLEELPKTRADMGYPPLVTPTSQIVGVQAVLNVLGGKRYGMVTDETRRYAAGYYGRTPAPIEPKLMKKLCGKIKPITCRPADLLEPGLAAAAKDIPAGLVKAEEDILSYCLFPEVALGYFRWRAMPPSKRDPIPADAEAVASSAQPASQASAAPAAGGKGATDVPPGTQVLAPLNGTFYRSEGPGKPMLAADGASVKAGEPVCIVEAMKLFNPVKAPAAGKIAFLVQHGAAVVKGQPVAVIS